MKKNTPRPHTMPRHEAGEKQHEPPSPQAILEARRAQEAADRNPLAFSMGEPLPGRSMLDKLRARQRADEARRIAEDGDGDTVIVLRTASEIETERRAAKGYPPLPPSKRRIMSTITPGHFMPMQHSRRGHD